jgi:ribosomal protein L23
VTGKKMYKQKDGQRPPRRQVGAAVARRRQGVLAQAAQPRHRLPKKLRAGLEARTSPPRRRPVRSWFSSKAESSDGKTRRPRSVFGKLELTNALIIDGAGDRTCLRHAAARNIPNIDVLPVQGINVTTFCAARAWCSPGGAWKRWRRASNDEEEKGRSRRDPCSHHHREVDWSRSTTRWFFKVARDASKPEIKAAIERLFNEGEGGQHARAQGKKKTFKNIRALLSDTKRAIGPRGRAFDRRDDGTVKGKRRWHSRLPSDHPSLRQLVQVDRSNLWKGAPIKLLTEGKTKSGGAQLRPHHHAAHRRRPQAGLPPRRL